MFKSIIDFLATLFIAPNMEAPGGDSKIVRAVAIVINTVILGWITYFAFFSIKKLCGSLQPSRFFARLREKTVDSPFVQDCKSKFIKMPRAAKQAA